MMVPAEQPFVPVITGGDVGAYSLAREFHEAYGVVSAVVPTAVNRNLRHSRILEAFPAGPMTEEGGFRNSSGSSGTSLPSSFACAA